MKALVFLFGAVYFMGMIQIEHPVSATESGGWALPFALELLSGWNVPVGIQLHFDNDMERSIGSRPEDENEVKKQSEEIYAREYLIEKEFKFVHVCFDTMNMETWIPPVSEITADTPGPVAPAVDTIREKMFLRFGEYLNSNPCGDPKEEETAYICHASSTAPILQGLPTFVDEKNPPMKEYWINSILRAVCREANVTDLKKRAQRLHELIAENRQQEQEQKAGSGSKGHQDTSQVEKDLMSDLLRVSNTVADERIFDEDSGSTEGFALDPHHEPYSS